MKAAWLLAAICATALLTAAAMTLVYGTENRITACERRQAVVEAFDIYTDALVAASENDDRTPAERAERAERVAAFRADLAERLAPLDPDC